MQELCLVHTSSYQPDSVSFLLVRNFADSGLEWYTARLPASFTIPSVCSSWNGYLYPGCWFVGRYFCSSRLFIEGDVH